jgi:acetolactate synthase-1/2/3 large subunit
MARFTKPNKDAIIFHFDMDVMKERMNMFYIPAQVRVQADSATVVKQILGQIEQAGIERFASTEALAMRIDFHNAARRGTEPRKPLTQQKAISLADFLQIFRRHLPENNLVLNESISNYPTVWEHIAPSQPGCQSIWLLRLTVLI